LTSSIDLKIVENMPVAPISVIGAGNIGRTLGVAWLRAGYPVTFGVRDSAADSVQHTRSQLGDGARVMPIPDALASASVVVLALPGGAVDDFIAEHGAALSDRIVVDAANRAFGSAGPMNSIDAIRAHADVTGIVRAFNSIGWENMANPRFDGITADLLYCADPVAQATAEELITALGLRPVLVGDLEQVHLVDSLTGLWAALAYGQRRGRNLAFKVLERA
jgi:predicted dinucleotide-binding enzyme